MSRETSSFRFLHVSDLHLEQVCRGIEEIPRHLTETLIEAPHLATERVFETALAERVDFVVLAGDIIHSAQAGIRACVFLAEQIDRLAEHDIAVYWAGGKVDAPQRWPAQIALPRNVVYFNAGKPDEIVHQRDGVALAAIRGASRAGGNKIRATDFQPDASGLFTLAVAHGPADAAALAARRLNYWALGGSHRRSTLFEGPTTAHFPGTPQGRVPAETGPHGVTLVNVDEEHRVTTSFCSTDWLRWHHVPLAVDAATSQETLKRSMRDKIRTLRDAAGELDLVIHWAIDGSGPLVRKLAHTGLAGELLEWVRDEFGFGPPASYTARLDVAPEIHTDTTWVAQDSILGEFLRNVEHLEENEVPLNLTAMATPAARTRAAGGSVAPAHDRSAAGSRSSASEPTRGVSAASLAAGEFAHAFVVEDPQRRAELLREAASLGVELLRGDEP